MLQIDKLHYSAPSFEAKIIQRDDIILNLAKIKSRYPLVFTNGCFDILHRGHVTYLAEARRMGSKLIVALNSDNSVRRLNKGDERPINNLANRMAVIASLESVDFVTYFEEDTPLELIKDIAPDVLVKGGDWLVDAIVGANFVQSYGGTVASIPFVYATSTTKLINRIKHVESN